jgi:alpha-1,2-mannosyltransferase
VTENHGVGGSIPPLGTIPDLMKVHGPFPQPQRSAKAWGELRPLLRLQGSSAVKFPTSTLFVRREDRRGRPIWAVDDRAVPALSAALWVVWLAFALVPIRARLMDMIKSGDPAGALVEYLPYIHRFWAGEPIYVVGDLHGFHYLPITLILGTPLTWMSHLAAGAVVGLVSAGLLAASVCYLAWCFDPRRPLLMGGIILGISGMAATISFGLLQLQILMTAAMIAATAAGMKGRYREMALWLALGIAVKPLAIVMALLAAVVIPGMRAVLGGTIVLLIALPYAFCDWGYLSTEYVDYFLQLGHITSAVPGEWPYQADFSIFLSHLGVELGSPARLAIRAVAALGTLLLAVRVASWGNLRATAFALLALSVCYIGLFNPRQEDVSFFVAAPAIATIAVLILSRNILDLFGWAWFALTLLLGFRLGAHGRWLFPGFMLPIWAGLLWLFSRKARWLELVAQIPGANAAEGKS